MAERNETLRDLVSLSSSSWDETPSSFVTDESEDLSEPLDTELSLKLLLLRLLSGTKHLRSEPNLQSKKFLHKKKSEDQNDDGKRENDCVRCAVQWACYGYFGVENEGEERVLRRRSRDVATVRSWELGNEDIVGFGSSLPVLLSLGFWNFAGIFQSFQIFSLFLCVPRVIVVVLLLFFFFFDEVLLPFLLFS